MLNAERRDRILEALGKDGRVIAAELAETFGVSEDTIRRDLRELAQEGLLHRVYGGAVPRSPTSPAFSARKDESAPAKVTIGRLTAGRFTEGQVLILDSGTTPLEVARHLPRDRHLTVITHSLPVAMALDGHPLIKVVVLGGTLLKESLSMVGATTVGGYQQVRADVCVLGVTSMHAELGIAVFDHEDAEVKRAIVAASTEVIVTASSEKLGTSSPFRVAPAAAVNRLVTDAHASPSVIAPFKELGIEVEQAR